MSNNLIKNLRELTGAGIMDIKAALDEAKSDKDKAVEILRKKGAAKMDKKAQRSAKDGIIQAYIHPGGKLGVLLELSCETDFVARTEDFQNLAKELALHIAASNPLFVAPRDVPEELIDKEKKIYKAQAKGKPESAVNKILEGKIQKYYEEACLLEQVFVKNPDIKVKDLLAEAVAKIGENIQVKRFARFVLGN